MGSVSLQVRIVLAGEIDVAAAPELAAAFEAALDAPTEVDAAGVTFIDSTGLGVVARAYSAAAAREVPFDVVLSEAAARVFRVAGLDEHIPYRVAD